MTAPIMFVAGSGRGTHQSLHDAVQTVLEHRFHIHGEKKASICRWGFRKGGARAVVTDVQVDVFAIDPVEGADFIPASYPGINLNHLFNPHPETAQSWRGL